MPDDKKNKPEAFQRLKRQALESAVPNNPLLAYLQHFRGREAEYSFGQFKRDLRAKIAAAEKTAAAKGSETVKKPEAPKA